VHAVTYFHEYTPVDLYRNSGVNTIQHTYSGDEGDCVLITGLIRAVQLESFNYGFTFCGFTTSASNTGYISSCNSDSKTVKDPYFAHFKTCVCNGDYKSYRTGLNLVRETFNYFSYVALVNVSAIQGLHC
jgi:hypothetical protein